MPGFNVNHSGSLKAVKEFFVNHGGSLKSVKEAYVNDGGVLKKFWPIVTGILTGGARRWTTNVGTTAVYEFHPDGTCLSNTVTGNGDDFEWMIGGVGADFEIRFASPVYTAGNVTITSNVWLSLDQMQGMTFQSTFSGGGQNVFYVDYDIRQKSLTTNAVAGRVTLTVAHTGGP